MVVLGGGEVLYAARSAASPRAARAEDVAPGPGSRDPQRRLAAVMSGPPGEEQQPVAQRLRLRAPRSARMVSWSRIRSVQARRSSAIRTGSSQASLWENVWNGGFSVPQALALRMRFSAPPTGSSWSIRQCKPWSSHLSRHGGRPCWRCGPALGRVAVTAGRREIVIASRPHPRNEYGAAVVGCDDCTARPLQVRRSHHLQWRPLEVGQRPAWRNDGRPNAAFVSRPFPGR